MSHLEFVTEELKFKAELPDDPKSQVVLRQFYNYIAQYREYCMSRSKEQCPVVPEEQECAYQIHDINMLYLEIDGKSLEINVHDKMDKIFAFTAGLEHAEQVTWRAKYSYLYYDWKICANERYKPAYCFFEEMSLGGSNISPLIGLRTIIQVRDEENGGERFSYYSSPMGKTHLINGTQTSGDIKDVSDVSEWHGDFESMDVILPITTDLQKRQLIEKTFSELCVRYGATGLSDYMVESRKQIIYGDIWSNAHLKTEQLPCFIRDLKALNDLVIESDPNAKLMLDGYLLAEDPGHPFDAIQFVYDRERKLQLEVIHLVA